MSEELLTRERLKELLEYDPLTGEFRCRVTRGSRAAAGSVAGTLDKDGYRQIRVMGRIYKAHRLAFLYMNGTFPEHDVDHIDHNPSNNHWSNLRAVTRSQNLMNSSRRKDNTSGCTGVAWFKRTGKWMVYITVNKERIYLGFFKDLNEAVAARQAANIKYGYHENHGARK